MSDRRPVDHEALARLCRSRRIRKLSLFGSVLARTDWPDRDVDLLVEFEPGATPSLFEVVAIEDELSVSLVNANTPSAAHGDAPPLGPCPYGLGLVAHKTAGSGFKRRTPARWAKATEGFGKRVFDIYLWHTARSRLVVVKLSMVCSSTVSLDEKGRLFSLYS